MAKGIRFLLVVYGPPKKHIQRSFLLPIYASAHKHSSLLASSYMATQSTEPSRLVLGIDRQDRFKL